MPEIPIQPWMRAPATAEVMAALAAAGGADGARFVGGCVRDTLIGVPVGDIDIATVLKPDQIVAALETAGVKAIPTGAAHGTITAISRGRPFEITTLRRDVETDGRHARVVFTDDWAADAARRDFRLNALYADAEGHLFDPTGAGVEDARAGRIVFVGDPRARIAEDALRILRFFRFLAWYGRGEPDREALAACAEMAPAVKGLSAERLAAELLKLLAADDPRVAVRLMAASGVLGEALPEAGSLSRFEGLVAIENDILFTSDPELRLAALLDGGPEAAEAAGARLKLSKAQKSRLVEASRATPPLASWMSPREMRRVVYSLGVEAFCDRVMLGWAASPRPSAAIQWRALLPMARSWPVPRLPLTGEEVMAAGAPPGPLVGAVLAEVEAWWIDNDFTPDKLSLVERLKSVVQGMVY